MPWILPINPDPSADADAQRQVAALASGLGCAMPLARILHRRGVASPEAADRFLNPRLKTLSDPFLLPDMRPAVDRILGAVDRAERIVLYGDYDVDGITSLALLTRLLRVYGARPECFLPDRVEEGYGVTADGLARCRADFRPQLLIALDCGTSSSAELAGLADDGVDAIVVDHHECKEPLPRCVAVVNPKRPEAKADTRGGDDYRYLCSVGLVFKLCHALLKTRPAAFSLKEYLDLVALGTVADIVPLVQENRILVQKGLEIMEQTQSPGLRALMEIASTKAPLDPGHLGFHLGPRLNAAGRLGTARDSLELLLTDDPDRARTLAHALDAQNRERQGVERETLLEAERQIGTNPAAAAAIVCGAPGWHPGVLGIVAARLCKKHHRPTLVIGFDETGIGKGSGRSIDGLSLVAALGHCGHLLERFGGHEMAAGITLRRECFEEFKETFPRVAATLLSAEALLPRMELDGELSLEEIDLAFLREHERLQPFGMANRHPVFLVRGVRPLAEPVVLKEKHLRLTLGCNGTRHEAIFFNGAADALPPPPWDVGVKIARNEWRGRISVQIQVQGIRAAE